MAASMKGMSTLLLSLFISSLFISKVKSDYTFYAVISNDELKFKTFFFGTEMKKIIPRYLQIL